MTTSIDTDKENISMATYPVSEADFSATIQLFNNSPLTSDSLEYNCHLNILSQRQKNPVHTSVK